MRSLSRAALVVLSAVSVLLGAAPAARAADLSLEWNRGSGVLWPGEELRVCSFGTDRESGQTLSVEVLERGTWVAKLTAAPDWWGCLSFDPSPMVAGPGTYTFRASSRLPSTGQVASTEPAAFTLPELDGRIFWLDSGEFEASDHWMGSGVRLNMRRPAQLVTRVKVLHARGQDIVLQRKSGSRWLDVGSVRAPATGDGVTLELRIPARAGMSTHRFVGRATTWTPAVRTGSFTVYQTTARTKAAYAAEARHYMKTYCPKTPVLIDTPAVRTGSAEGYASAYWQGGRGGGLLATQIELRSGMAPDKLRSVALHECAHVVQYRSVVEGRSAEVHRSATKLWPRWGVEGQADCMSYQITRDHHWFGYVNGCSRAQLRNAASMWQAYGRKYQAAVHRW